MSRTISALLICSTLSAIVQAQTYPLADDTETIDGIMKAYYEVVSAPPGEARNWVRDRSLHHPEAQVAIVRTGEDGKPLLDVMTLTDFHEGSGEVTDEGFFEYEINRIVQRHGSVAHVWSVYEWKHTEDGDPMGQGVNTIQMYHDGNRWWITSWMYDGTRDAPPVPEKYLPGSQEELGDGGEHR